MQREVAYRVVVDAEPITVSLVWWRTDRPPLVHELVTLVRESYARNRASTPRLGTEEEP